MTDPILTPEQVAKIEPVARSRGQAVWHVKNADGGLMPCDIFASHEALRQRAAEDAATIADLTALNHEATDRLVASTFDLAEAKAEVARLTQERDEAEGHLTAVVDVMDRYCRALYVNGRAQPTSAKNIAALVEACELTYRREVDARQKAESSLDALREATKTTAKRMEHEARQCGLDPMNRRVARRLEHFAEELRSALPPPEEPR